MALMAGIVNYFPRFHLSFVSHLCNGTIHRVRRTFGLTKPGCSLPCSEGKGLREMFGYVRPGGFWRKWQKMADGFYRKDGERISKIFLKHVKGKVRTILDH